MPQTIHLSVSIPESMRGRRLDQALAELVPDYSRSRLQQWIRAGQVALDGRVPKTREIVQGGEQVQIDAEVTVETVSNTGGWNDLLAAYPNLNRRVSATVGDVHLNRDRPGV